MSDTAAGGATALTEEERRYGLLLSENLALEAEIVALREAVRYALATAREATPRVQALATTLYAQHAELVALSEELAAQQSLAQQIAVEWRGLKVDSAALYAELVALRAVAAAAETLSLHLPMPGAMLPHRRILLGEYGAALLCNLRDALYATRQHVAPDPPGAAGAGEGDNGVRMRKNGILTPTE